MSQRKKRSAPNPHALDKFLVDVSQSVALASEFNDQYQRSHVANSTHIVDGMNTFQYYEGNESPVLLQQIPSDLKHFRNRTG